jgi:hypothetical protein
MMYEIHGFAEVIPVIDKKTLVVCDIDYTLVHYGKPFIYFLNEARRQTRSNQLEDNEPIAYQTYKKHIHSHLPVPTDPSGFIQLLMEVSRQGKLIFVTGRPPEYEGFTRTEFKALNLDYDFFEIHYIGPRCKAQYCKQYIPDYDQICLIDDYKKNIQAFQDLIPYSKTFLFRIH